MGDASESNTEAERLSLELDEPLVHDDPVDRELVAG